MNKHFCLIGLSNAVSRYKASQNSPGWRDTELIDCSHSPETRIRRLLPSKATVLLALAHHRVTGGDHFCSLDSGFDPNFGGARSGDS